MSSKRKLIGLFGVVGAALSLASCQVDTRLQVTFATSNGKDLQNILTKVIAKYEKLNPDVHIVMQAIGGGYAGIAQDVYEKINTNVHPDIAIVYPDATANYIYKGVVRNLDKYINDPEVGFAQEDLDDFIPAFMEEGQKYMLEGTYSMPFSKSTEVIYYNKAKIIGLELPGVNGGNPITSNYMNNLTWDELFDNFCPALDTYIAAHPDFFNKESKLGYSYIGYDSDSNLFITLAKQYGIPYTSVDTVKNQGSADFNNQEMKDLMYKFAGYAAKHYISTKAQTGYNSSKLFQDNSCLLSIGSTAGASYQFDADNPEDIGVARIPQKDLEHPTVILQGPSLCILTHKINNKVDEERFNAAWDFYKFISNYDNTLTWAIEANYMPVRQSVYEDDEYKAYADERNAEEKSLEKITARIAKEVIGYADYYFTSPVFKGSAETREAVDALVGHVFKAAVEAADQGKKFEMSAVEAEFKAQYETAVKAIAE